MLPGSAAEAAQPEYGYCFCILHRKKAAFPQISCLPRHGCGIAGEHGLIAGSMHAEASCTHQQMPATSSLQGEIATTQLAPTQPMGHSQHPQVVSGEHCISVQNQNRHQQPEEGSAGMDMAAHACTGGNTEPHGCGLVAQPGSSSPAKHAQQLPAAVGSEQRSALFQTAGGRAYEINPDGLKQAQLLLGIGSGEIDASCEDPAIEGTRILQVRPWLNLGCAVSRMGPNLVALVMQYAFLWL